MDPVTAIGVAGSIVQFVDFGIRVVSKGYKLCRSVEGCLPEDLDLEVVTSDLLVLQTKLVDAQPGANVTYKELEEFRSFEPLIKRSSDLAEQLLTKLNAAKAQGRFRKWNSLRQAVKSVWSKKEVDDMAERLQSFKSELQLKLLVSLREHANQETLERNCLSTDVTASLQKILTALEANSDSSAVPLQRSYLELELEQEDTAPSDCIVESGIRKLHRLHTTSKASISDGGSKPISYMVDAAILSALAFNGMHQRNEAIPIAHANTFSWIFRKDALGSWDSFVDWLETGEGIYWINGKAASGKSTLMRYITESPLLKSYLDLWRSNNSLEVARFYFWATGSKLQQSQCGLFRSLLHQILSRRSSSVRAVFPEAFERLLSLPRKRFDEVMARTWKSWTVAELKEALHLLLEKTSCSVKYCLLIDGLDEFDGDHIELTSFFAEVSALRNVKLCLSSRPLPVFDQQLGRYPKLRLQDLTVGDITRLVTDKLTAHPRFREISIKEELGALDLIDEIVKTSAGVFLWVSLVVKSIVQGLTDHDGVEDLHRRLRDLPPELDELYGQMLSSISPPFYVVQGAKLLQLVYQSPHPISVLELSLSDQSDHALALSNAVLSWDIETFTERANRMVPKLKSRCAGLLETDNASPHLCLSTVRYLHLTVREFLENPTIWTRLLALTNPEGFDANTSLLRAKVLLLKMTGNLPDIAPPTVIYDIHMYPIANLSQPDHKDKEIVNHTMAIVLQAEASTGPSEMALLDEIDRMLSRQSEFKKSSQWCWPWAMGLTKIIGGPHLRIRSFLAYAVQLGLTKYVKAKLELTGVRGFTKILGKRSALDYATWANPKCSEAYGGPTLPWLQPEMVKMLLESGFDPNWRSRQHATTTPWISLVQFFETSIIADAHRQHFGLLWLNIVKLYLLFGADVRAYQGRAIPSRSVWPIFKKCFAHLPSEPALELKRLIEEKEAEEGERNGYLEFSTSRQPTGYHSNLGRHRDDSSTRAKRDSRNATFRSVNNHSNPPRGRRHHYTSQNGDHGEESKHDQSLHGNHHLGNHRIANGRPRRCGNRTQPQADFYRPVAGNDSEKRSKLNRGHRWRPY